MGHRRLMTALMVCLLLMAAVAPAGGASPPGTGQNAVDAGTGPAEVRGADGVDWPARAAQNHAHARERAVDQLTHPEYNAGFWALALDFLEGNDPSQTRVATDPFRLDWAPGRGSHTAVSYANRYGATIHGSIWLPQLPLRDPVTAEETSGPLPVVLIVSGTAAVQTQYLGMAQGLAEAGYLVMTFDPQGQGLSDTNPNPVSFYCDPQGAWRERQELGIREEGACAGEVRSFGDRPAYEERFFVAQRMNGPDFEAFEPHYTRTHARYIFGAIDAVAWLLSEANPHRDLVDADRIGIAGHSLGAHAAFNLGNGDPHRRFAAAVMWDSFGPMLDMVEPTVPTMFQHADREELFGPYLQPPDPDSIPGRRLLLEFQDSGVDAAQLVLRGSTHSEWQYVPHSFLNPFCRPPCTASRKGERVALYYTLAWFDRYLKGAEHPSRPGRAARPPRARAAAGEHAAQQRADATRRLTARVFDGSVDGSSIGSGSWDPVAQRNLPYLIEGEAVSDHLSFLYRSSYAFAGSSCHDWRGGCGTTGDITS